MRYIVTDMTDARGNNFTTRCVLSSHHAALHPTSTEIQKFYKNEGGNLRIIIAFLRRNSIVFLLNRSRGSTAKFRRSAIAISSFGKSSMSGRACRERASVSNEETTSVPSLILMHSTVFSVVLYSRRRRRRRSRRVQQYRPRVSVSDTQRSSLFTAPTGVRPERNGVLSAGAEYSRRPINKTQRRKAKQRASRIFPRSRSLFLPRWSLLPERPPERDRIVAPFPPVLRNTPDNARFYAFASL